MSTVLCLILPTSRIVLDTKCRRETNTRELSNGERQGDGPYKYAIHFYLLMTGHEKLTFKVPAFMLEGTLRVLSNCSVTEHLSTNRVTEKLAKVDRRATKPLSATDSAR